MAHTIEVENNLDVNLQFIGGIYMFEFVILIVFSFSAVLLVLSFLRSRRNLEETRKKIEEDLEKEIQTFRVFSKEYIDSHKKNFMKFIKLLRI